MDFDSPPSRSSGLRPPQAAVLIYYVLPVVLLIQAYFEQNNKDSSKTPTPKSREYSKWPIIITAATVACGMFVIPWILFYMAIMALSTCKSQDPT